MPCRRPGVLPRPPPIAAAHHTQRRLLAMHSTQFVMPASGERQVRRWRRELLVEQLPRRAQAAVGLRRHKAAVTQGEVTQPTRASRWVKPQAHALTAVGHCVQGPLTCNPLARQPGANLGGGGCGSQHHQREHQPCRCVRRPHGALRHAAKPFRAPAKPASWGKEGRRSPRSSWRTCSLGASARVTVAPRKEWRTNEMRSARHMRVPHRKGQPQLLPQMAPCASGAKQPAPAPTCMHHREDAISLLIHCRLVSGLRDCGGAAVLWPCTCTRSWRWREGHDGTM